MAKKYFVSVNLWSWNDNLEIVLVFESKQCVKEFANFLKEAIKVRVDKVTDKVVHLEDIFKSLSDWEDLLYEVLKKLPCNAYILQPDYQISIDTEGSFCKELNSLCDAMGKPYKLL